MANEAVLIELLGKDGDPMQYTVAEATDITKGTLMYISADPRTMAATSATSQYFVGVLAADKVGGDGSTKATVITHAVYDMKDSGAGMTIGTLCQVAGANTVKTADEAGALGECEVVGQVLETVAASEVSAIKIRK